MVDVTHIDGNGLGYPNPDFKVDFYANGGTKFQPGCPFYVGLPSKGKEALFELGRYLI